MMLIVKTKLTAIKIILFIFINFILSNKKKLNPYIRLSYSFHMPAPKKEHPTLKPGLHPRNKHRERYNFKELVKSCPELNPFVKLNDYEDESIDFFNPVAVKMLNKALLKHYYNIDYWDIPANY